MYQQQVWKILRGGYYFKEKGEKKKLMFVRINIHVQQFPKQTEFCNTNKMLFLRTRTPATKVSQSQYDYLGLCFVLHAASDELKIYNVNDNRLKSM